MAAGSGVLWDERALDLLMERSAPLHAHLAQLGREGIAHAKSIAPDAPVLQQGYIDSFVATIGHERSGIPVLCIANTDWKTIWIERGTAPHATQPSGGGVVSTPAFHVLDKTLDSLRR